MLSSKYIKLLILKKSIFILHLIYKKFEIFFIKLKKMNKKSAYINIYLYKIHIYKYII